MIKKVKNNEPWRYVIINLNGEEIVGTVYKKILQKSTQNNFRVAKMIKRKSNKLHVKWKSYDNSFNS